MSADLPARAAVPDRVGRTGGAPVPRYQGGGGEFRYSFSNTEGPQFPDIKGEGESSDILFPIRLRGAELHR